MIRKLSFFIAEAFIGMKRSSLMITVSLATVFISLLIFGFFLILNLNLVKFTSFLNSKLEIRVFLKDDLTKKEVRSFKAQLLQLESVKSVDILDKKQEWHRFKQQYSQLQLDELVQENPLPLSMTIQLINQKAIKHLENNRIVIFSGGTGNPYFTTDTTAALRAAEIKAEAIFKATKVNGVYDKDPVEFPNAKKFTHLSHIDVLQKKLKVMDSTALSLSMDNNIPIIVFDLLQENSIKKALFGEKIGTQIGGN